MASRALRKAKQYIACFVCKREVSEANLYMCIKDDCESFGEIYCKRCGDIVHEKMDHEFADQYLKPMSFQVAATNIQVKCINHNLLHLSTLCKHNAITGR